MPRIERDGYLAKEVFSSESQTSTVKKNHESKASAEDQSSNTKAQIVPAYIDFGKRGCKPNYPREAIKHEWTGATDLTVTTSKTGFISGVEITKSSGHEVLDKAVASQLMQGACKQKPGTINGEAQSTQTHVRYVWRLN